MNPFSRRPALEAMTLATAAEAFVALAIIGGIAAIALGIIP